MLKRLIVVLVLLAISTLYADGHSGKTKQADSKDNPPYQVAAIPKKQVGSASKQSIGEQHIQADVRIVGAPQKDVYDKWAFRINAILAAVGIVGVGIGVGTLLFLKNQTADIKRQANIMETQAKDARVSAAEATRIALVTARAAQESAEASSAQIRAMSGKIAYQDIFGDSHTTPFRFVWKSLGDDDGGKWLTRSFWLDCCPPSDEQDNPDDLCEPNPN